MRAAKNYWSDAMFFASEVSTDDIEHVNTWPLGPLIGQEYMAPPKSITIKDTTKNQSTHLGVDSLR